MGEVKGDEKQQVEVVRLVQSALESKGRDGNQSVPAPVHTDLAFGAGFDAATGVQDNAISMLGGTRMGLGGAPAPAMDGFAETPGHNMSLQLAMPSEEMARQLAGESSGIAWRAGVKLSVGKGQGGMPILNVEGTAVGNSVACYLIQDRLFMMH